jgi:hypothetical protein
MGRKPIGAKPMTEACASERDGVLIAELERSP